MHGWWMPGRPTGPMKGTPLRWPGKLWVTPPRHSPPVSSSLENGEPVAATPGRGHDPDPARPLAAAGVPDRRQHRSTQRHRPAAPRPRPGPAADPPGLRPPPPPLGLSTGPCRAPARGPPPSTARKSSVCGGKRACGSRPAATSASASGSRRRPADRLSADRTRPRLGPRLPVRRDRPGPDHQDPPRHRRVHPGVPLRPRRLLHRRRRTPSPPSTGSSTDRGATRSSSACDNGPELTAYALQDWCRFTGAGTSYIDPGSPWQNPWVESYGSRMRDELLAIEQFDSLLEAHVLVQDWREEYNTYRPHSALGMLTPAEFADRWRKHQLQLT